MTEATGQAILKELVAIKLAITCSASLFTATMSEQEQDYVEEVILALTKLTES